MRGSAVERSQNRQQKLDGIVAWYFNHVMESLPLMLQGALLLLGCGLSRYLWDISIVVTSVVIGVTSLGLVFYLFIIVAGAASESCPYQTPGSHILRHLGRQVWSTIRSAPSLVVSAHSAITLVLGKSEVISTIRDDLPYHLRYGGIVPFLWCLVVGVPHAFAVDVYHLGRASVWVLPALPVGTYHVANNTYSALKQRLGQQTLPDFRCISWTLQTSLDKPVHLTASEHLATITDLAGSDPTLAVDCFNVFVGCVTISGDECVIMQGLERLSMVSAGCLFRTFHHLWVTDPTSSVLVDLRRRYRRAFPFKTNFNNLPFYHTAKMIHASAHGLWGNGWITRWDDYKPSGHELIPFAQQMTMVAKKINYQVFWATKVWRWVLRFALHFLSLDPPSSASVIADCLTIVAIDLDCDISNIVALDERCVQIGWLYTRLTKN